MTEKTWTWAFIATFYDDINRTVEVCRACEVQALELHPTNVAGLRNAEIDELRERLAGDGISVSSFHLPFPAEDDIASFYESTRRAAVDHMIHWIGIAGWWQRCLVHCQGAYSTSATPCVGKGKAFGPIA